MGGCPEAGLHRGFCELAGRYNAEAVLAAFTARLRGTVDLGTAQGDLVDAVHYAFEPAHVSVWLTPIGQHESLGALPWHGSTR